MSPPTNRPIFGCVSPPTNRVWDRPIFYREHITMHVVVLLKCGVRDCMLTTAGGDLDLDLDFCRPGCARYGAARCEASMWPRRATRDIPPAHHHPSYHTYHTTTTATPVHGRRARANGAVPSAWQAEPCRHLSAAAVRYPYSNRSLSFLPVSKINILWPERIKICD